MSQPSPNAGPAPGTTAHPPGNNSNMQDDNAAEPQDDSQPGVTRRIPQKVVGLPRTQTFQRQRSEVREKLEPVRPTPAERRAVSVDRRGHGSRSTLDFSDPRSSAPDLFHQPFSGLSSPTYPISPPGEYWHPSSDLDGFHDVNRDSVNASFCRDNDSFSLVDVRSMTTTEYEAQIERELDTRWILNLSMHFRDKSNREKFFVTYRQKEHLWRRVTISVDYRNAPENSLEADLSRIKYQRDKSARIYEAIRDSLPEIEFYPTVTNLKLETLDGRLHVHVVEDSNEIINYPHISMVQHVDCMRVRESELTFDSHMSGFVYKVRVHGRLLIKKEIPGPDNVDEFLYEINALSQLVANGAENVIRFYGIVVDDDEKHVTGLLISYAARGAMIDVIYDGNHQIPWPIRERWARQIVGGLAEIHEAGFVQGDFTLSNIVVDGNNDAKIIDINRRGCPIGWEPPEVTPLIESNQRISMYIGVKSDLYQLGMVLWALATQEDEPDRFPRPLKIDPNLNVPAWYRRVVDTCLNPDPRQRVHATHLLSMFPEPPAYGGRYHHGRSTVPMNGDAHVQHGYLSPAGFPHLRSGHPANFGFPSHPYQAEDVFRYPSRGRSPPSPSPSDHGGYNDPVPQHRMPTWSETIPRVPPAPSVSDVLAGEGRGSSMPRLQGNDQTFDTSADRRYRPTGPATEYSMDDSYFAGHNRRFPGQDSYYAKAEELVRRNSTWASPSNEWQPDAQHGARQDATELASTPRGSRVSGGRYSPTTRDRSVSRGRRGRSSRDAGSDGRRSSSRSPGEQRRTDGPLTRSPPPPYQEHGVPPEQVSDSDHQAKKHRRRKHHRQHEQRDASPEALSPANSDVDLRFVGSMHDPSPLDSKATTLNGSASPPHRFSIDEDLMEGVTPTNSQDVDMDDEMDEKRAIYASVPQAVAIDV